VENLSTQLRRRVEERLNDLPDEVWNCERCGSEDSMQLRRSSLNKEFMADDIGLKCMECRYYATHGVPFLAPGVFDAELEDVSAEPL